MFDEVLQFLREQDDRLNLDVTSCGESSPHPDPGLLLICAWLGRMEPLILRGSACCFLVPSRSSEGQGPGGLPQGLTLRCLSNESLRGKTFPHSLHFLRILFLFGFSLCNLFVCFLRLLGSVVSYWQISHLRSVLGFTTPLCILM